MSEPMDTFDNIEPISETPMSDGSNMSPEMDTFDNIEPILEVQDAPKDSKEEAKEEPEAKPADQTQGLDDSKEDEKKDGEADSKSESKSDAKGDDGKETDESKGEDSKDEAQKTDGKTFRLKNGEDKVDVSQESTVKVKVNGKNEFVSLKELTANYSGKVAYDEKFNSLDSDKRTHQADAQKFKGERDAVVEDLQSVMSILDDEARSPMEALNKLLEITDRPVHTFHKRALEAQIETLEELQDMSAMERENYWQKLELDALKHNQTTRDEKQASEQTQRDFVTKVDSLMEKSGISEDKYVESLDTLKQSFDAKDITPEHVIEFASFKPVFDKASGFCTEQFSDDLGDKDLADLTAETARVMFHNNNFTEIDAAKYAAKSLGFNIDQVQRNVEELNSKLTSEPIEKNVNHKAGKAMEPDHIESFDDFDTY